MDGEPQKDDFLTFLETKVRDALDKPDATAADMVKAIEAGVKLAQLRHKISDNEEPQNPGMGWGARKRAF